MDLGSHLISHGAKGPLGQVLRFLSLRSPRFLTHRIPLRSVAHLARLLFQIFTLTEPELRFWDRRTLADFIRQHTGHPAAYFLMSFMASIFFLLPPWRVSAGESIRCLRWLLRDYSLSDVEGGMDQLAHALLGFVQARNGEVVLGAEVVRIARGRRGWIAATRDGCEYEAKAVCCNLAPCDFLRLLDPELLPPEWVARARAIVPSGNAHQLKVALRRPLIVASIYGPTRRDPEEGVEVWKDRSLRALAQIVPGLLDEVTAQIIPAQRWTLLSFLLFAAGAGAGLLLA